MKWREHLDKIEASTRFVLSEKRLSRRSKQELRSILDEIVHLRASLSQSHPNGVSRFQLAVLAARLVQIVRDLVA